MPDFTKKSPQNRQPPFPQVASTLTNPAFRADGMTFEALRKATFMLESQISGLKDVSFWICRGVKGSFP